MERNDGNNELGGATGDAGADEFSGSGTTSQDRSFDFSGTAGTTGTTGDTAAPEVSQAGLRDRARDAMGTAGERLSSVGSTVRERAGTAKNRLADVLESGAERLRNQRSEPGTLAGVTAGGEATVQADARLSQLSDRVAGGMQSSAEWLRDADLDGIRTSVEQQVKEHPGRTLLIAAGLGYLIGRAFRSNQ
jgi:ElaB/YqjD/DUF883 family membrane-anchored ribosome-binding protein